jgi:hypothetical protein
MEEVKDVLYHFLEQIVHQNRNKKKSKTKLPRAKNRRKKSTEANRGNRHTPLTLAMSVSTSHEKYIPVIKNEPESQSVIFFY